MAKTELHFRDATPEDIPTLWPLIESAYRGESSRRGWTTEANLIEGVRIDEAGLLQKITEPEGAVLLATMSIDGDAEEKSLVGCCEILHKPETGVAYFGMFAVNPALQRGGIGRQVLARAEIEARKRWGVPTLEMIVIAAREDMVAWYLRRGYSWSRETRPFPYAEAEAKGKVLRDDLYLLVLTKDLTALGDEPNVEMQGKGALQA